MARHPVIGFRPHSGLAAHLERVGATLRQFARMLALWAARSRQRKALAGLEDHLLRDIGVTREEARREAGKPF